MITPALAELVVSAVHATTQMHHKNTELELGRMQLCLLEKQLDHNMEMAGVQATRARTLIHALIERRVDAIQSGFASVLALYAEQARHYMQEQKEFRAASFKLTDPLEAAQYRARLTEIDRELGCIRADSQLLYEEMNTMLHLIGASARVLPDEDQRALKLAS